MRKMTIMFALAIILTICCLSTSWAGGPLDLAANKAVMTDRATADEAITTLRKAGPAGLQKLWDTYADRWKQWETMPALAISDPEWQRLNYALDKVAGQHDARASHLYWYTDLTEAQAAAKANHKPILALHMLGNLDEDLSCANSRFFRVALYANKDISKYLQDNYILYWHSVRPVPKITIDFGDGRQVVRTITGNSIHYVLDSEGRPLDGLPGLHSPQAFLTWLTQMHDLTNKYNSATLTQKAELLKQFHTDQANQAKERFNHDLRTNDITADTSKLIARALPEIKNPTAADAAPRAMTKALVEMPMVNTLVFNGSPVVITDEQIWDLVAAQHRSSVKLDEHSKELMRSKYWTVYGSKLGTDTLLATIDSFETQINKDSVKNEYALHAKIHEWFLAGAANELKPFNDKIYTELFLTPGSDPWLGLVPANAYSAIDNEGLINK